MDGIRKWWRSADDTLRQLVALGYAPSELEKLEWRVLVLMAEAWRKRFSRPAVSYEDLARESAMNITRMLCSLGQTLTVTGTEAQVTAAARRMARRTRSCVTICVIVGYYHRRGCDDHPAGGVTIDGN